MSDLMLPSFPPFKKYSTTWTWWKKHKKRFKNLIYSEYQRKAEENFAIELYMWDGLMGNLSLAVTKKMFTRVNCVTNFFKKWLKH